MGNTIPVNPKASPPDTTFTAHTDVILGIGKPDGEPLTLDTPIAVLQRSTFTNEERTQYATGRHGSWAPETVGDLFPDATQDTIGGVTPEQVMDAYLATEPQFIYRTMLGAEIVILVAHNLTKPALPYREATEEEATAHDKGESITTDKYPTRVITEGMEATTDVYRPTSDVILNLVSTYNDNADLATKDAYPGWYVWKAVDGTLTANVVLGAPLTKNSTLNLLEVESKYELDKELESTTGNSEDLQALLGLDFWAKNLADMAPTGFAAMGVLPGHPTMTEDGHSWLPVLLAST